ncbi:hypothetical protein P8X24_04165 [Pyrococcus kukulkanii]|uniref:hypothetical protein n=1 Tax=Pyrococcus kukulkanii TaxID=1609559 RepID=UPI0035695EAA
MSSEIIVRVKIPESLEKYLSERIVEDIKLEIIKEIQERLQRAEELLRILEKSELKEEDAKELERELKEALARRYGVL